MQRRNFLRTALLGTMAAAAELKAGVLLAKNQNPMSAKEAQEQCDLVAVIGGEPEALYRRAITEMGGMSRFVKKGQKVVLKPNIGWDRAPELAANTNPALVALIIKDCLACGASEVVVFDHSCDEWQASYRSSGIQKAVEEAGGRMAFAHDEKYYKEVNIPGAVKMKNPLIHEAIINADVWINIPILKNHGGAKMTISMKNYMGIVWDRRYMHSNNLQQCIADAALFEKRPVLNIVDAYRIMTQNGPKGKTLADVQTPKAIFMSTDIVAADTAATQFFAQFSPMTIEAVKHIGMAEQLHLGTTHLEQLNVKRIRL